MIQTEIEIAGYGRARPYAGTGPVDVGKPVSVAAVEGATLLVYSTDLS